MRTYFIRYQNIIVLFSLLLGLIFSGICDGFIAAENVSDKSLRLHILAQSDSTEDQAVKLLVRDKLLSCGAEILEGSENANEAAEKVIANKDYLISVADKILEENGFSYKTDIVIEEEYYETRQYENIRLPAGKYLSCKVILGNGEGKNWWCIMFPPLCIPAATKKTDDSIYSVYKENGVNLVTEHGGYEIKFRIVELIEELINEIRSKN